MTGDSRRRDPLSNDATWGWVHEKFDKTVGERRALHLGHGHLMSHGHGQASSREPVRTISPSVLTATATPRTDSQAGSSRRSSASLEIPSGVSHAQGAKESTTLRPTGTVIGMSQVPVSRTVRRKSSTSGLSFSARTARSVTPRSDLGRKELGDRT